MSEKELVLFKGGLEVARSNTNTIEINGLESETTYSDYQVAFEENGRLSKLVDVPDFTTLSDPTIDVSPKTSSAESGVGGSRQLNATVEPESEITFTIEPMAEGLSVSDTGLIKWTENTPEGIYTTTIEANNLVITHTLTLTAPEMEE